MSLVQLVHINQSHSLVYPEFLMSFKLKFMAGIEGINSINFGGTT